MVNFTKQQIADQCRISGPQLVGLPSGIDGAQLLWAMSGNESSFGANCAPRHEPAFDVGGVYAPHMQSILAQYGSAAAYSYGPWQIMYVNAWPAATPEQMSDLKVCAAVTVAFLNRLIARWKPEN